MALIRTVSGKVMTEAEAISSGESGTYFTPIGARTTTKGGGSVTVTSKGKVTKRDPSGKLVEQYRAKPSQAQRYTESVARGNEAAIRQAQARVSPPRATTSARDITPTGVYDKTTRQTRILTPYERIAVGSRLEGQRQSYADPVQPSTFSETRKKLLQDPSVERVYVSTKGSEPSIVGVEYKPTTIVPPVEMKPSKYGGFDVQPAKKVSVGDRIKGSISMFRAGFGFEKDPIGGDPRYTKPFSYQVGTVAGVVSLGPYGWEKAGATVASALYRSPKVWRGTVKVAKFLKKPGARLAQKQLVGVYGFTKTVQGVQAYREEGATGIGRVGLQAARTTAGLGGFSAGFKAQTIKNIEDTKYVLSDTRTTASTRASGEKFVTVARTRGKLTEYFRGEYRQRFNVYEKNILGGESKNILTESGIPSGTQRVLGRLKSDTRLYTGRVRVKQSLSESGVSAITASKEESLSVIVPEGSFRVGKGKSSFTILDDRYVQSSGALRRQVFTGGSRYGFVGVDRLTKYTGETSFTGEKLSGKISYREGVYDVSGRPPSYSISDTSMKGQIIVKQTGSNVLSSIYGYSTPKTMRTGGVKLTVLPQTKTQPSTSKAKTKFFPESVYAGKSFIPPDLKLGYARQYNIQDSDVRTIPAQVPYPQKTFIIPKQRGRSKSRSRSEVIARQGLMIQPQDFSVKTGLSQVQTPAVTQKQEVTPRSKVFSVTRPVSPMIVSGGFSGGVSPPPPFRPAGISLFVPSYEPKKQKQTKSSLIGSLPGDVYSPSLEAQLFNKRGEPEEFYRSGLFIRPIRRKK